MAGSRPIVLPSLLDRLVERRTQDPASGRDPGSHSPGIAALRESIQLDLEALLNTRNPFHGPQDCRREEWPTACPCEREHIPEEFELSSQSILTYGLPDLSLFGAGNLVALERALGRAIRRFEPRLQNVSASVVGLERSETGAPKTLVTNGVVKVIVSACLRLTGEALHFDVVLSATGTSCQLREA